MCWNVPTEQQNIKTHLSHPCKSHLYSMLAYAKKKKRSEKTGCQFGAQHNSIPPLSYEPPQMFHSAFAAFGHSKSASATAFPPIVL